MVIPQFFSTFSNSGTYLGLETASSWSLARISPCSPILSNEVLGSSEIVVNQGDLHILFVDDFLVLLCNVFNTFSSQPLDKFNCFGLSRSKAASKPTKALWSFWLWSRGCVQTTLHDFVSTSRYVVLILIIPKYRPRSARLKWSSPVVAVKTSIAPAGTALKSETDISFFHFNAQPAHAFFVNHKDSKNDLS